MQSTPDSRVDDFLHQIVNAVVVARRSHQIRYGSLEIHVDPIRTEEHREDFRLGRGQTSVCRRIFGMIGRGEQWRPRRIAHRGEIPVAVAERDGKLWSPEDVVIFCIEAGNQRIGTDQIAHCKQPGGLDGVERARPHDVAESGVVLLDRIGRPEAGDVALFGCARDALAPAEVLRLVELLRPLAADELRWRPGAKLIRAVEHEWPQFRYPRSLRRYARWKLPRARTRRRRHEPDACFQAIA